MQAICPDCRAPPDEEARSFGLCQKAGQGLTLESPHTHTPPQFRGFPELERVCAPLASLMASKAGKNGKDALPQVEEPGCQLLMDAASARAVVSLRLGMQLLTQ
eukprot:scaffold304992_cov30-Tisochrysis_lutea.AAC.1